MEFMEPIDAGRFTLEFKQLPYSKVVRIYNEAPGVSLAPATIATMWNITPIIQNAVDVLKKQQFTSCVKIIQLGVNDIKDSKDVIKTALNILEPIRNINSETYGIALELIYKHPELLNENIQL